MSRFNCATLPAELRSKQNANWRVAGALAELIDNSLGKGRGDAGKVTVYHNPRTRVLSVLDDGVGMNHIGLLFQGGRGSGRIDGDIGEYGAGGTKALLWLASKVDIWTLRRGMVMRDTVVWDRWFKASSFEHLDVSDTWERATPFNTPAELMEVQRGTLIRLHLLPGRVIKQAQILKELAMLYSPGLRNFKRLDWVTLHKGEEPETDSLVDPYVLPRADACKVDIDFTIEYAEHMLPVRGKVFYDDETSLANSRVQIGYGHRVIFSTKECFNSPDSDEHYNGIGISGWLDLGDEWKEFLTVTKDDINREDLKDFLMKEIFKSIEELLKMSTVDSLTTYITGLQIGIEQGLKSRPGPYEAELIVRARKVKGERHPDPDPKPRPEPDPDRLIVKRPHKPKLEPDAEGDQEMTHTAASYGLRINCANDTVMEGHLCIAYADKDSINITVNSDHPKVKEALKAKPINKMALHFLVLIELANCVAEAQNAHDILKAWFPQSVEAFENVVPGRDMARTLSRFLVDRVSNPMPIDDNEESSVLS